MSGTAERIVDAIEKDMSGRSGLDLRELGVDADTRKEIHDEWVRLASEIIGGPGE
jgi:hypothetical protein